jgi:UDP-N-acetylglucosamine 1-carboxyvinyltransferase
MGTFVVEGGHTLRGAIRPAGNKNSALPCLCASLLTDQPVTVGNVPRIRDVETLLEILGSLGAEASWVGENRVRVDASGVTAGRVDRDQAAKIRGSLLLAGPLLGRFGEVRLPPPGGDVIGRRRMDTHFLAFEALGVTVRLNGDFELDGRPRGADIFLDEPSVPGTENAVMAAVLARGSTRIRNAAAEPHVQDLCRLLVAMGARIDGIGTGALSIEGVERLGGASFDVGADHIETGSFIGLAAVTGSDITIEGAPLEHLDSTLLGFRRLGVRCTPDEQGRLHVHGAENHVIRQDAFGAVSKIDDGPWPAFPADLTSIALVTATQCLGTILIHEKMFESRMFFTDHLVSMGARIILCDPHRAVVVGPAPLRGERVESPDIRAGMALLIAALGARGESRIHNIRQIERGYERIDHRLRALGAHIDRRGESE